LRISCHFRCFHEISKGKLPKNQQKTSLIKKWVFQTDKKFFQEAAKDMGMIPNKTGDDIGFER
jgi:dGTPase